MASPLSDLDQLILKCRDEKAKSYIQESVSCYKAGAFRSAIISTWIAVSFDIIDKLKELSLTGDKEAINQLQEFESALNTGDINRSLKFERNLLGIAKDKFELISHIEFIDLERLQQDRNRCAHPSMTSDGDIFNPSAELARVHIRSAVEYLLQYPPAQGRYALETLVKEVNSEYFPTNLDKAITALENSPLFKARKSLVKNFIIILLKKILNETQDYKEELRITTALNAIMEIHRGFYNSTLEERLSNLFKTVDDTKIYKTFPILFRLSESWEFLEPDVKQKLEAYVENLPTEQFDEIDFLLSHTGLSSFAIKRIRKATRKELDESLFFYLPQQISDRMVELYVSSSNFADANSFASTILRYAHDFTKKQVEEIVKESGKNSQIKESIKLTKVINELRKNKEVTNEEFDVWLVDAGLRKYARSE
ncbi:hypothetical protein [Nitrosomonas sp.]|uniref:hypothetical protein n=1 Tax=Nitrosomonas sp. TaxID=42353 RepID=UPI001D8A32A7|nr:hypothetical protein [Nitrosomonas sp.]MCB1948420.1 hypothetical protein [Nitrosomonas sp.]